MTEMLLCSCGLCNGKRMQHRSQPIYSMYDKTYHMTSTPNQDTEPSTSICCKAAGTHSTCACDTRRSAARAHIQRKQTWSWSGVGGGQGGRPLSASGWPCWPCCPYWPPVHCWKAKRRDCGHKPCVRSSSTRPAPHLCAQLCVARNRIGFELAQLCIQGTHDRSQDS